MQLKLVLAAMELKPDLAAMMGILFILLGITFLPCFCCMDSGFRNIIFRDPIPNMVLKNYSIKSSEVLSEGSCRVMCYMDPNCVSINIGPLDEGKHKCELNNVTEENHVPFLLVNKPGYTYLAIENPCSSSPCLNNGTCQAGFTSKGFCCVCQDGFIGENCQNFARNCAEIYRSGKKTDGVYIIKPDDLPAFDVFCDQTTEGGGWTVFQKRLDGSVKFYLKWADYKSGFGDLNGEFWLGLDKIHRLTLDNNSMLRVDLEDFQGETRYAEYNLFGVTSEKDKYRLILGDYSGSAGDSLSHHRNRSWSTPDQDNDEWEKNCARTRHGAWWYVKCYHSNLNGRYHHRTDSSYAYGVIWRGWGGQRYLLKRTEMKLRPTDF
ncbi:microfibril-associated glycoprotein 4-like isoform X1 [Pocillopora verrucosa]|uniref:microfibril-associated glycoprotein 4-like isoform X1 n=3 Tax=Pocillopora verrucosa TaxID=203993 RepID=UPI00333E8B66